MAKQKAKSSFTSTHAKALQKAHETARAQETSYSSFGELPTGINNGIAELEEVKLDQYKKGDMEGEWFFYARATVISPATHDNARTKGLSTSIMEPLYDTDAGKRQTFAQHLEWVYNELRKLGIDTDGFEAEDLESVIEEFSNDLADNPVRIRFRTWGGGKWTDSEGNERDGRVNHSWEGLAEDEGDEEEDEVVDNTKKEKSKVKNKPKKEKVEEPEEDEDEDAEPIPKKGPKGKKGKPKKEPTLEELAELADGGDSDAEEALTNKAYEVGLEDEDIEGADSWAELVEKIEEAQEEKEEEPEEDGETEEDDENEGITPEKGDTVKYKPKGKRKAISCIVTAVNTRKETCTLKSVADKTMYKDIEFSELEED